MRRLRTVSLVVTIVTAVLGATITPAQAMTTVWTGNSTPTPVPTTTSADEPAPAPASTSSSWIDNSQYYSLETSYEALDRCIVVKDFGNITYQTTSYLSYENTQMNRFIQRPGLLQPTTVIQFFDKCGSGRVKKALPSARVEITTAWSDNVEMWDSCDGCISVSYPWGISYTPTTPNKRVAWAHQDYATSVSTTDQFTITSSGTMASWSSQISTEVPVVEQPVYPTIKMTNELTRLVIHSGDRSHSFGPTALPKKSVTIQ